MSKDYMPRPCGDCPFRLSVKPYLHPKRAIEIAYVSKRDNGSFQCHRTLNYDTDEYDENDEPIADKSNAKECAGMLTMRANAGIETPKGFEPSPNDVYKDPSEMYKAYKTEWNKNRT